MKIIVFGIGGRGKEYYENSKEEIVAFVDNNPYTWNKKYNQHMIDKPENIPQYEYDRIVIAVRYKDNQDSYIVSEILGQLKEIGVPQEKVFLYSLESSREVKYLDRDFLMPLYDIFSKSTYKDFFEKMHPDSIAVTHKDYIIDRCKDRKLFICGTGNEAVRLAKYLSIMGIQVVHYIDDERAGNLLNKTKIISSIDLVYEETDKLFILITGETERYGALRKKFNDMGCLEDVDFTYHTSIASVPYRYSYDVTLSFNRVTEGIEGFELFGDIDNPNAVKIVALGGSTTESELFLNRGWVQFLAECLQRNHISAVVYGGGICAYTSSQELLKLIRDVIPLKPDIVLSYSGYNDLSNFPTIAERERYKKPFITPFQVQFVNQTLKQLKEVKYSKAIDWDIGVKDTVYYGLQNEKTCSEHWIDNMRMMHTISKEFGIYFASFFQPYRDNGYYKSTDTQNIIYRRKDTATAPASSFVPWIKENLHQIIKEIKNYDFITDFSDIFAEEENIYYDVVHVCERGNQIIANKIFDILTPYLRRKYK